MQLFKLVLLLLLSTYSIASERIVALSPAINEVLFALGVENNIVGNTTFCTYPEASKRVEKVGGYFAPNLERIVALRPDLVIIQNHQPKFEQQLQQLGIKTLVVSIDRLEDILVGIDRLGAYFGKVDKATAIKQKIEKKLDDLKGIITDQKILIVFHSQSDLSHNIFVAGHGIYFHDIIEASGNHNAYTTQQMGQPVVGLEQIIRMNPDVVIILAPYVTEVKSLQKPWLALPINAAKKKNVFVVDQEYAGIPSDRLHLLLDDFKGFFHDVASH
jgi:iron complex transport system substrate-binding protein